MRGQCAYGWPVRCGKDAELEIYDFKRRETVPACAGHAGLVVCDVGRSCLVKPILPATAYTGGMANRNPNDRRERDA